MTETAAAPVAETVRCGHMTSTGPCHRPQGHPKTGHISKSALDAKRAKALGKGKALTRSGLPVPYSLRRPHKLCPCEYYRVS